MQGTESSTLFLQSVERCESRQGFMAAFYKHFRSQSEAIHNQFIGTDFNHQNRMLLRSIKLSSGVVAGDPDALEDMARHAESHNRHHHNVQPELYQYWLDALIKTASEFDSHWDERIEDAWRATLSVVITHMIKRY